METERRHGRWTFKNVLDLGASFAMIIAAVAVTWTVLRPSAAGAPPRRDIPVPAQPLALTGIPIIGSSHARVVVLEFSDFQCPYCAKFANDVWPALKSEYVDTGRVQVGFRHLPLTKIHPFAERAAEAASCAGQQGRFWEMHDLLFDDQQNLAEAALSQRATTLRLNQLAFSTCMEGAEKPRIKADAALAAELQFSGTPTFVIGLLQQGSRMTALKVVAGALPIADFRKALDEALEQAATE